MFAERYNPHHGHRDDPLPELAPVDTSISDYVWLPFRFEGERALLDWHDEWRIEDHA